MKLLILGARGQVGWELQRSLAPLGDVVALDRAAADLEKSDALEAAIAGVAPEVIVNAAAYTAVDRAESEPERATAVNTIAVGRLGQFAARRKALLVHYSTDYVFDGGKAAPYVEIDATNPQSVYGRSKRDGEEAIRAAQGAHLIFRTSWVHATRGANFIKTVLRLARERDELRIVADQFGAPTSAELIADVTAHAVVQVLELGVGLGGTYHLAAAGETSWHGLARFILAEAALRDAGFRVPSEAVRALSTSEYPTTAKRPLNSRLDTSKLRNAFGLTLPPWEAGVRRTLSELLGH